MPVVDYTQELNQVTSDSYPQYYYHDTTRGESFDAQQNSRLSGVYSSSNFACADPAPSGEKQSNVFECQDNTPPQPTNRTYAEQVRNNNAVPYQHPDLKNIEVYSKVFHIIAICGALLALIIPAAEIVVMICACGFSFVLAKQPRKNLCWMIATGVVTLMVFLLVTAVVALFMYATRGAAFALLVFPISFVVVFIINLVTGIVSLTRADPGETIDV